MEGIREVALARYEILPDEEKSTIQRDFNQIVTDGNVSEYFKSTYDELTPEVIDEVLGTCNKDGNLDFTDFITSTYILKNQIVLICDGCSSVIIGRSFFSCYECFCNIGEDSYDLCCGCYRSKKFNDHNHQEFFDNHTLHNQSRTMLAKMKSGRAKRDTLEQVYVSLASVFLELAGEVKTQKDDSGDFNTNPKEKLGEISRRAMELQKMSDAGEKEDDKNLEKSNEDVEISTWMPTSRGSVDLLGAEASFETFGQPNTVRLGAGLDFV